MSVAATGAVHSQMVDIIFSRRLATWAATVCCIFGLRPSESLAEPRGDVTLSRCMVEIKDEANVPALADGVLMSVAVEVGATAKEGDVLASQDAALLQMKVDAAKIELLHAQIEAGNDYDIQYARAASRVAQVDYESAVEANKKIVGTIPEADIRRYKLQWQRNYFSVKQAEIKKQVAEVQVREKGAIVATGEAELARLKIAAPIPGEVVDVSKHVGEWVRAGDPVMRIVRFDKLKVAGFLNIQQHAPADVLHQPVTVEVELASGPVSLPGKIVHVSGLVEGGGNYRVSAEVNNDRQRGQWILRPGLTTSMTIHFEP